jgi:hypothetical protein
MAWVTQVPSSFITGTVDTPVLNQGQTGALNTFTNGRETTGDISATNEGSGGAFVADPGEQLTIPTTAGTIQGTYVSPVTLSTTSTLVGVPGITGINLQLNAVNGHLFRAENGTANLITAAPIDQGRLGATASVQVAGVGTVSVNAPVSGVVSALTAELTAQRDALPALSPLRLTYTTLITAISTAQPLVTSAADAAVFTIAPGTGELAVICFAAGTLIWTPFGELAVERLCAGDTVITRSGPRPIRWIGFVTMDAAKLAANPHLRPIRIRAGALGPDTPSADLVVSPQHRILVRSKIAQRMFGTNEVLVAAKQLLLLDGIDIAEDLDEVEYFHFLFDRHEVVTANGAEAESLFTGPEALKAVGPAAREEILALFPSLAEHDYAAVPARALASGRMARRLAVRHRQNAMTLVN